MDEVVFDSEEVIFTFEGGEYSAMVDFYGEDEWKLQSLAIWNQKQMNGKPLKFPKIKYG